MRPRPRPGSGPTDTRRQKHDNIARHREPRTSEGEYVTLQPIIRAVCSATVTKSRNSSVATGLEAWQVLQTPRGGIG